MVVRPDWQSGGAENTRGQSVEMIKEIALPVCCDAIFIL